MAPQLSGVLLLFALTFPSRAAMAVSPDDAISARLPIHTPHASVGASAAAPAHLTATSSTAEPVEVDELGLLAQPALLHQAMAAAIHAGHAAGIRVLLPVYEKCQDADPAMLAYARAIDARLRKQPGLAAAYYNESLYHQPSAHGIRLQLAEILIEDQKNSEAARQLALLPAAMLPETLQHRVAGYQSLLARRSAWSLQTGIRILNEENINNAPRRRTAGNWTFDAPVHGRGLAWDADAAKLWTLSGGRFLSMDVSGWGKHYIGHKRYDDAMLRLAPGLGHADMAGQLRLFPFLAYRRFGQRIYSRNAGVRIQWDHHWAPRLKTMAAMEAGRQIHPRRRFLDHRNHLISVAAIYHTNAAQSLLLGLDTYREWDTPDVADRFHMHSLRVDWARQWPNGIGARLHFNTGLRTYRGPTLLTHDDRRRDHILGSALSVWHRKIDMAGFTPRLTLSHQRIRSNSALHDWRKHQIAVELQRAF